MELRGPRGPLTTLGLAAAIAICALALAACGSSGSDSAGTGTSDTGSESGSDSSDPIKLMAMGPIEAPECSIPWIGVGAGAAVDEINAEGGVDGRQIELIVCNDENDPNKAVTCAREAIKEEVA